MVTRTHPDRRTALFAAMGVLFAVAVTMTDEVRLTSAAFASSLPWLALALGVLFLVTDGDQFATGLFALAAALALAAAPLGVPPLTTVGGIALVGGSVVGVARLLE